MTASYTIPDKTANNSKFVELTAKHLFGAGLSASANAYYRSISTDSFNGDINDDAIGESLYQPNAASVPR